MKVYESTHQKKWNFTRVPQIKIKNKKLEDSGFQIGKEFRITYSKNKIILEVIEDQIINS